MAVAEGGKEGRRKPRGFAIANDSCSAAPLSPLEFARKSGKDDDDEVVFAAKAAWESLRGAGDIYDLRLRRTAVAKQAYRITQRVGCVSFPHPEAARMPDHATYGFL